MELKDKLKPLGLYLHIPFCIQKCLYCDFTSFPSGEELKEEYLLALIREIFSWKEYLRGKYYIKTVFVGGGTPTCLSALQLERLGGAINKLCEELNYNLEVKQLYPIEFTIEANPGTVTVDKVKALRQIGVNRVSLGLQSAQNTELQALGRIHTYEDFLKSYDLLQRNNLNNINVDLMADIPLQTLKSYEDTLQKILVLSPKHVSSYSLIVEEGTPFYQMQQQDKLLIPDEETDRQMYELTQQMLKEYGYSRYEISNYAMRDKECIHNTIYWKMEDYLGLGLGASSYFAGYRFHNTENIQEYLKKADHFDATDKIYDKNTYDFICSQNGKDILELSKKDEMEEFVFLGLRMTQGISMTEYKKRFGVDFREQYENVLPNLFNQKLLIENRTHNRISLSDRGIDISNMVLAEFLLNNT